MRSLACAALTAALPREVTLGMTEVPVHIASELSEAQARAYRIADNATAAGRAQNRRVEITVEVTQ